MIAIPVAAFMRPRAVIVGQTPQTRCNDLGRGWPGGRVLRSATVTAAGYPVGVVVCLQAKDMKEPWCLAASTAEEPARPLVNLYGKRWGHRGRIS